MDLGQTIIIGLSIFLGLWYIIGSITNRRRGLETFRWLREALGTTGKVDEARWIGSSGSGARLTVSKANRPFQRIEVVFLLDSRELLPLWLVNLMRGKQDEMILKATLRSLPSGQIEVARSGTKDAKELSTGTDSLSYQHTSTTTGFDIFSSRKVNDIHLAVLQSFIDNNHTALKRISLQKKMPHLILRADLPPLREGNLESFFNELIDWLSL